MGVDEQLWAEEQKDFNEYLHRVGINMLQKNIRSIISSLEKIQAELNSVKEKRHRRGS